MKQETKKVNFSIGRAHLPGGKTGSSQNGKQKSASVKPADWKRR